MDVSWPVINNVEGVVDACAGAAGLHVTQVHCVIRVLRHSKHHNMVDEYIKNNFKLATHNKRKTWTNIFFVLGSGIYYP